jgi:polyketide biosynthesis enoyl-CoA hydratase PksH
MNSSYATLQLSTKPETLCLKLARPDRKNSINRQLIQELHQALDHAESTGYRIVVLEGEPGLFCTGLDFEDLAPADGCGTAPMAPAEYMTLLKRFASTSRVMMAKLDGTVSAGGVGLVAACDLVISTRRTQFTLPEALWGLLPGCVLPFLIRRVGFQKAYAMTLTTQSLSAEDAHRIHLVDELTEDPDEVIRRITVRQVKVDADTVLLLKRYFRSLWLLDDEMEQFATEEVTKLAARPEVQDRIHQFLSHKQYPWVK